MQQTIYHQVRPKPLQEREHQPGRIICMPFHVNQRQGYPSTHQKLQTQLRPSRQPLVLPMHHLDIVVRKSDRPKRQRRQHNQPHKRIRQIRPQQRRNQDRNTDQHTAHRRRAALLLVRLRPLFTNVLPYLKLAQLLDDIGPNQQADQQRRQARKHSAKRQVAKNAKQPEVRKQLLVQQPIEQTVSTFSHSCAALAPWVTAILTAETPHPPRLSHTRTKPHPCPS